MHHIAVRPPSPLLCLAGCLGAGNFSSSSVWQAAASCVAFLQDVKDVQWWSQTMGLQLLVRSLPLACALITHAVCRHQAGCGDLSRDCQSGGWLSHQSRLQPVAPRALRSRLYFSVPLLHSETAASLLPPWDCMTCQDLLEISIADRLHPAKHAHAKCPGPTSLRCETESYFKRAWALSPSPFSAGD